MRLMDFVECQCRGGAAFVATQALGWALFSASVASLAWLIAQLAMGFAYCIRCYLLITCAVMAGAYLASSLRHTSISHNAAIIL